MNRIFSVLILISSLFFTEQKIELDVYDFDDSNWSLDSTNGVYYQIGLKYCTNITSSIYQSMGIYVPKEYLTCTESGNKYKCNVNSEGKKGSYKASNAPIVMPVDTPGYAAMKAPTNYNYQTVSKYVTNGIIYAFAGCRGKYEDNEKSFIEGAPWAVTDLKSAIRYIRYNKNMLPGDTDKIYTFGMSGGGAQSCLMGVTGNSPLYTQYLKENGAVMKDKDGNELKDNVKGSQCWCPITNLDTADAAYEWNMGQYYSTGTRAEGTFTKILSNDLSNEYVKYVNDIKLKDPKGNELTLTEKNSGSYYDYLKLMIEESLNNFLADTTFPWTRKSRPGPGPRQIVHEIENLSEGETYNTTEEYINYLNTPKNWVTYDKSTNKATITSVGDFVQKCKNAKKAVSAFDDLNRGQAENYVFGTNYSGDDYHKHFDKYTSDLLKANSTIYSHYNDWNSEYPSQYEGDLDDIDSLGNNISHRLNMYNPMYYLIDYYDGYKTSNVADYFRINTGIFQTDTGNVVEMNLYLALINYGKNVNFTTVWEQEHVKAERKDGDSDTNFINWIAEIEKDDTTDDTTDGNFSNLINLNYLIYLICLMILF